MKNILVLGQMHHWGRVEKRQSRKGGTPPAPFTDGSLNFSWILCFGPKTLVLTQKTQFLPNFVTFFLSRKGDPLTHPQKSSYSVEPGGSSVCIVDFALTYQLGCPHGRPRLDSLSLAPARLVLTNLYRSLHLSWTLAGLPAPISTWVACSVHFQKQLTGRQSRNLAPTWEQRTPRFFFYTLPLLGIRDGGAV